MLGIERLPAPWEEVGRLSSTEVYYHVKRLFLKHPHDDGIYFQGGKLRILDIIELLEEDLRIPVLHPGVAQAWEIQKRLNVRQAKTGYGRMLAEMP